MSEQERRQEQARKKRAAAKREAQRKAAEKKMMIIASCVALIIVGAVAYGAIAFTKNLKKTTTNPAKTGAQPVSAQTANSDQSAPSLNPNDEVTYVEHGMSVAKYVSSKTGINIRKAPNTGATILGGAGYGDKIEVIAELYDGDVATGWYKTVDGAYVYGGNLSDSHPETQVTAAQEQASAQPANNQQASTQPAQTTQAPSNQPAAQTTQAPSNQTTQAPNNQQQKESPAPYYGTCVYPRVDVHLFNEDGTERCWCSLNTDGLYYNSKSESFKDNGNGTFTDAKGTVYKVGK